MTPFNRHIRMTASEIAMGRYMRAPDHPAEDEFAAAFDDLAKGEDPPAGAGGDKGGADGTGNAGEPPAGSEPGGAPPAGGAGGAPADEGHPPPPPAAEPGATPPAEPAAATPPAEPGKEPAAPAAEPGKEPGKEPAAATPPAPPAEDDDALLKRLAAAVKKTETDAPPAAPAKPAEEPLFTKEEEGKIEHFRKEWPEVAEAFDLQSRALAAAVLKHAFSQIAEQFVPLRETVQILAQRTHYGDLKEKVGEYTDDERDNIVKWVDQQPAYLQAGMKSVIEGGTAEEVADLVGRYREATGAKLAGAGAAQQDPPGGEAELSDEAKKAAAALAPVNSQRSAVTKVEDPDDFSGAFAKFSEMLTG